MLAAHAQKGLPAFGIYGHDVQDLDDNSIPADVAEKLLRFARAAQAVATMRGKSYLSLGNTCMGIAGSIVNADFLQQYLGMRTEYVSLVEILRRVDFGIFDKEEFRRAMQWVDKYCKPQEGHDYNEDRPLFPGVPMTTFNGKGKGKTRAEKDEDWAFTVKTMMIIREDEDWAFTVKTMMIIRDLMQGSDRLLEMGYKEEAIGHNAIAAGVQGQRQWTDYKPNFDFPESMMCTSFDWNGPREAFTLATENDSLNGLSMLFGHLLTNRGVMFSDIRTYWSPDAVERVSGKRPEGAAAGGFIHLINSGATTLDATGAMSDADGKPTIKHYWEMQQADMEACLNATSWMPADRDYFRGGGYSSHFLTRGGMPMTTFNGKGKGKTRAEKDEDWAFTVKTMMIIRGGANHGAIAYGHIGADLITLASMLRIPVCMHNVADATIFRPAAWNAFGMDKEGADYRAYLAVCPVGIRQRHHEPDGGSFPDTDGTLRSQSVDGAVRLLWRLRHDGRACGPVHQEIQL